MFRRIGARFNAFAATSVALQASNSSNATSTSENASENTGGGNASSRPRRRDDNVERLFNSSPAVNFHKISDDIASGYYIRMTFTQAAVLLKRNAQNKSRDSGESKIFNGPESYLQIPSTTVARMLAVIEGNLDECQVIGRQFKGTFKTGAQPNTFVLTCKSNQSASERQNSSNPPPSDWTAEFDVADAILLQRFLKQSLHYLQGFYHSQLE